MSLVGHLRDWNNACPVACFEHAKRLLAKNIGIEVDKINPLWPLEASYRPFDEL